MEAYRTKLCEIVRTQHLLSAVAPRRSLLPAPSGPRHLQQLRGSRLEYRVKPTHTPTQGTRINRIYQGAREGKKQERWVRPNFCLEVAATLLWVGGWETWIRYPAHTKNGAITSSRIVDVDKRKCRA